MISIQHDIGSNLYVITRHTVGGITRMAVCKTCISSINIDADGIYYSGKTSNGVEMVAKEEDFFASFNSAAINLKREMEESVSCQ